MDPVTEKKLIKECLASFRRVYGKPPVGWYYGRCSTNSQNLVTEVYKEEGAELKYYADSYADDRPYYEPVRLSFLFSTVLCFDCFFLLAVPRRQERRVAPHHSLLVRQVSSAL
jgi:hypothetical protein